MEDEELSKWCRDLYVQKDANMEVFNQTGAFPAREVEVKKTLFPRIVMGAWCTGLGFSILYSLYATVMAGSMVWLALIVSAWILTAFLLKIWLWNSVAGGKAAPMLRKRKRVV